MFQIGEYVVHITGGICQITEIAPLNIPGADKDRNYYVLNPIKPKGGKVFVPTDSEKAIRQVMTDKEAWKLIDEIPNIKEKIVENEKLREACYKEAIRSCDCRELIGIIKSLHTRRNQRLAEGKKTTATDYKYYKLAEENLFSELAFAIGRERDEMPQLIEDRVGIMV